MILEVLSREMRRILVSWRNLWGNEVRGSPLQRGSTQFGVLVHGASIIPIYDDKRLCITAPFPGARIFETSDEYIFKLNRNKGNCLQWNPYSDSWLHTTTVPIIVVFTKFELFVARLARRSRGRDQISMEVAETMFQNEYSQAFEKATCNTSGKIPYTTVASASSS